MSIFSLAMTVLIGVLFFVAFFHFSNFLLDYFRVKASKKFALENSIRVIIFINEAIWSIIILPLNKVILLSEKVSLTVRIIATKIVTKDRLKVNCELFFLKTPNINKNITDNEINISGKTKLILFILLAFYI